MEQAGIYLHVPFCARKCLYCDFYSRPFRAQEAAAYVGAAQRQLALLDGAPADSVYFGGGTPSLLSAAQIAALLGTAAQSAQLAPDCEVTLEMNPATCSDAKLRELRAAGVNRLSIGVQSTDDAVLRVIGRLHDRKQALETIESARAAGFTNLSADLMLGLPLDTRETMLRSIDELAVLPLTHISAYILKIMDGTPFAQALPAPVPSDDEEAERYLAAVERLAAHGIVQYEISNFARDGCRSRHNLKYWDCGSWYGIGPAAHSSVGGRLWSFDRDLGRYLAAFSAEKTYASFTAPLDFEGEVDAEDFLMLQLRKTDGLSLKEIHDKYSFTFDAPRMRRIQAYVRAGYAVFDGDRLRLTPRGMLVSNSILAELI